MEALDVSATYEHGLAKKKATGVRSGDLPQVMAPQVGLEPTTLRLTEVTLQCHNWLLLTIKYHVEYQLPHQQMVQPRLGGTRCNSMVIYTRVSGIGT